MTDDRSLERAARSWLEIGPTTAPDHAVEAAILRIQTTSQEPDLRIRWRKPVMITPARLTAFVAVGALVIVGALAMSGLGGTARTNPTTAPTLAPTAAPTVAAAIPIPNLDATYTSHLYGYSIAYPTGWAAIAGNGLHSPVSENGADKISNGAATLRVSSARIPSGQSDRQWLESYCEGNVGDKTFCTAVVPNWPAIKFGRYPGLLSQADVQVPAGDGGGIAFEAVALVGGRGYVASLQGTVDIAMLQAFIDTMQFDASSAVDLPRLTGTFTSPWYGFSIGTADGWETAVATKHWVDWDDSWPNVDEIRITGTDTLVDIGSQALKKGQTFDQWLAAYHADAVANTPPGCGGGEPSTWKSTLVGLETARYTIGCNWATAVLPKDGRVYTFSLRHTSFDASQQLRVSDFLLLLRSVLLDPAAASD